MDFQPATATFRGVTPPPTPEKLLGKFKDFVVPKPDDVMILVYPRSGTHLVHEIVWMLTHGTTDPAPRKEDFFIDFISEEDFEKIPSPRILNSHHMYPTTIANILKPMKVINVYREPRDALVSIYNAFHKKNKPFEEFWNMAAQVLEDGEEMLPHNWFLMYRDYWEYMTNPKYTQERDCPVLWLSFADLKNNRLREIKKIATYIGKTHPEAFYEEIFEKTKIEHMRDVHKNDYSDERPTFNTKHFRKGIVGDWKNWLTVAQNEKFEELYSKNMEGMKVPFAE